MHFIATLQYQDDSARASSVATTLQYHIGRRPSRFLFCIGAYKPDIESVVSAGSSRNTDSVMSLVEQEQKLQL